MAVLSALGLWMTLTQVVRAADPPPPACGFGQLRVTVTDKDTGLPLADQWVSAVMPDTGIGQGDSTDANGFASIDLRADRRDEQFNVTVFGQDGYQNFQFAQPVTIISGTVTARQAEIAQGGVLAGTLLNVVASEPLTQATVAAYAWNPILGDYSFIESTQAEDDGSFSIEGLADGEYALRVRPDNPPAFQGLVQQCQDDLRITYSGGAFAVEDAQFYPVTAPNTVNVPAIEVDAGSTIAGTVRRADDNTPFSEVEVQATEVDGTFVEYGRTNLVINGRYCIGGLEPGEYVLAARPLSFPDQWDLQAEWYQDARFLSDAQPIPLTNRAVRNFELEVGGVVTGRITDAITAGPASGADVSLSPQTGGEVPAGFGQARVDAAGYYTVTGLLAGDYLVEFSGSPFENYLSAFYSQESDGSPTLVRVTAGETVGGIDGSLPKGGIITGRVTDGMGDPLDDVWIDVRTSDGELIRTRFTNAQGEYSVSLLESGGYSLFFGISKVCECYAEKYYNSTPGASGPELVQVTAGETTDNIDVVLECSTTPPSVLLDSFLPLLKSE